MRNTTQVYYGRGKGKTGRFVEEFKVWRGICKIKRLHACAGVVRAAAPGICSKENEITPCNRSATGGLVLIKPFSF